MTALALARKNGRWTPWPAGLAALVAVEIVLLILFGGDARAMAAQWWESSTYEHCLLVGPIAAGLVWGRRRELAILRPTGWRPGLVAVAAASVVWLIGSVGGAALLREAGLLLLLIACVVACLGPQVARGLAFPLAYLAFLIPVGEGWEPALQLLTARSAGALLRLEGVPAHIDGVFVRTPAGLFEVAEACSGVKFLLAMLALAALAAHLGFRSWPRRLALMAVALVLPIAANTLRAWGTMAVAEHIGAARAGGFDHLVYGWFFFAAVLGAMLVVAWPFFDRDPLAPAFDPAVLAAAPIRGRTSAASAALASLLIAGAAVGWSQWVESRGGTPVTAAPLLIAPPGWNRLPTIDATWQPRFAGAVRVETGSFASVAGERVTATMAVFDRQSQTVSAVSYGQGATPPGSGWTWNGALAPDTIRIAGAGGAQRAVVERFAIGGIETADPVRLKLEALRSSLLGQSSATVVLMVGADERGGGQAAASGFARATGPLPALARRAFPR